MKLVRITVLVALGAAVVAHAGVGRPEAAGGASKPGGSITVTGLGTVTSVPDEAEFSLGVQTTAETAREALGANSEKMKDVLDALRKAGVDRKDVKTQDVSVSPSYADKGEIDGYTARNSVSVKIRDLSTAGAVLDAASNAGANEVYGPSLTRSDQEGQQAKALREAVADARRKAEALADAAGVRLGSVTAITEGANAAPSPYYEASAGRMALDQAAPIEPGTQDLQASVTVTFAIA
jgi:uncharacterized protein YggE